MPKTQRPQQRRQPSKEREKLGKKKNTTTIKPSYNNKKFDKSKLKVVKKKKIFKKLRDIKQTTVHPHPIKMH